MIFIAFCSTGLLSGIGNCFKDGQPKLVEEKYFPGGENLKW